MSVRKLTSVQEARRVLRERRQRCAGRDFLDAMVQDHGQRMGFSLGKEEVAAVARGVGRRKFPFGVVVGRARSGLHIRPGVAVVDWVSAAVRRDGAVYVRLSEGAVPERDLAIAEGVRFMENPARFVKESRAQRRYAFKKCGPCTERELVAIDALLEVGDKRAEKLAKACAKGGGVLEGSLKKRRRRK